MCYTVSNATDQGCRSSQHRARFFSHTFPCKALMRAVFDSWCVRKPECCTSSWEGWASPRGAACCHGRAASGEHLRPEALVGGEGVDANVGAHCVELRAEGGVRADVLPARRAFRQSRPGCQAASEWHQHIHAARGALAGRCMQNGCMTLMVPHATVSVTRGPLVHWLGRQRGLHAQLVTAGSSVHAPWDCMRESAMPRMMLMKVRAVPHNDNHNSTCA